MYKILFLLLFTLLSFAETLTVTNKNIETDKSITIESKNRIFDTRTLYTHKTLVECFPEMDAVYKVLSTKKVEIMPNEPWESDTKYTCHMDTRFVNADRNKINDFTFTTPAFGMKDYHYFEKEKLLRIEFNDRVDLKTLKSNVKLYKLNKLAKTELQYSIQTQDKRTILFKINEEVGTSLELHLLTGLKNAVGKRLDAKSVKQIHQERRAEVTLNEKRKAMHFKDAPIMVAKEGGEFAIRLFFNDTFYRKPLKKFMKIEGLESFHLKKDVYLEREERREYNITQSYYYVDILSSDFKPNSDYTLTLYKGLSHYQELKVDKVFHFRTGDRKKSVNFNNVEPYVSNLAEIGFTSVNVGEATVIVEKVTHENYRYFINYNNHAIKSTGEFTEEVFSKNITLDNPKNKTQKQKILFKDMITNTKYGVYKISIVYEDKDAKGETVNKSTSKVIFVSDIGMSVNLSSNQAFVSLLRLSDGQPIANATVDLYSANNIRIASVTSNEDGIAIIDKTALMGKEPKAIIVSSEEDKSFLLLNKPVNDVSYEGLKSIEERYKAFVYFQSNIIRPAGTVHALITVKDRDFISASKLPVKVIFSKLYEATLHEEVYTTDAFGLIDFSYKMSSYDKTGAYQLKVKLGDKVIGSEIIDVEAFMPPKIENEIKTDKDTYSSGDFIQTNVSSAYLFGAPSSYLNGKLSLTATAFDYAHPKYKDYSFTNDTLDKKNDLLYLNRTQDIHLDSKGETSVLLATKTQQKVPSILQAMIGATIMDDTQPVSTYKKVLIYPYKHMVGVSIENSSIQSGKALVGKTVLLDPMTDIQIQRDLTVVIKKINWHYSYSNGQYKWEKESNVVDTFLVPANQEFSRDVSENGSFIVEVHDRLEKHSSSTSFEVTGWGYTNMSPKEDLKSVEITFEDKLYKKGDVLKASFNSPVLEGRMLITLKGSKVHWHKSIAIEKGVAQVDVPLDIDFKRGVYLHATAIRKTDTQPSIIPFRAMGYAFIKPDRTKHQIGIEMVYEKVTSSKKIVPLKITTDRETALLVSVVDSGILNITEQKVPEIFDFFNPHPDKKLLYFDLYDKVMHYLTEGNVVAFGAGGIAPLEKRKKHLAPENLDRVKPFMLWSKIIHTSDKKATVELDIPEFNGRASIVVIALNKDAIGVKSQDIIVKDDIMIKPSYPRFLLNGDSVEVPIRVFNTTEQTQQITLEHSTSDTLDLQLDIEPLTLDAKSSKVIYAKLNTLKEGKGSIELSTKLNAQMFSKSVSLAVMSPYAIQTKTFQDTTSKKKRITIPEKYRDAKVLVSLSDNLLGQLRGDLKYLVTYPYGCAEQTSSKITAMYYAKPFMKNDSLVEDADNFIRQGVKKLVRMQNWHGEFSYWENGGYVNTYASLYTAQTLLELDEAGYTLDDEVKRYTIKALKAIANGKKLSVKYSNGQSIYAAYILSMHDALDMSTANRLYDNGGYKKYYFSWFYMVAILKNMHQDELADNLYAGVSNIRASQIVKVDYSDATLEGFSSKSRDMFLFLYLNAKHFTKNKDDFNVAKKQLSKLYSTHEKAMAFKAMSAYLGKVINDDMEVLLKLNGEKTYYTDNAVFTETLSKKHIDITPLSGVVNYSIEAYKPLPRVIKNKLSTDRKLSIKREFIDAEGKALDLKNLKQGSKIYSKITVANYPAIQNIVLNQRIPACMDIVNTRISKSNHTPFKDKNLLLDYKDIRDDRVLHFMHVKKKTKSEKIAGTNKKKTIVLQNKTILYTPLIVTTVGECHLPAVTIEAMYDTRVNDYAKEVEMISVKLK